MFVAGLIGFLFGFVGSMPVAGPIALLVFARSIEGRPRSALALAVGCALAETAYVFLAFWGFSVFLSRHEFVLPLARVLAGVMLLGLGLGFLLRREKEGDEATPEVHGDGVGSGLLVGFSITALNPVLIVTWTGAITTLYASEMVTLTPRMAWPFSLSACAGIAAWFVLLVWLVQRYRDRFRRETLARVVRVTGGCILALGVWFLASLAWRGPS